MTWPKAWCETDEHADTGGLPSLPWEASGSEMYALLSELFPICRSITGDGVRATLRRIAEIIPLKLHEVPSGTGVFDWTVPREWNVKEAYVEAEDGSRVIDFRWNNLHLVGYSEPVDVVVSLSELDQHLYSLEDQPDAIPYVTSYYTPAWGFCLAHAARKQLREGRYHVVIDSELKNGSLTYGETVIPGETKQEVFLSTYVCHPSMANNELSGPVVTTWLVRWILERPRRFTYRAVFLPETIGSLTYLSRHLDVLRRRVIAGFNITCVGDDRAYSYLPSRNGSTLADRVALSILGSQHPGFTSYSFLERGSDERQYCSPGVDLPMVSVMRSKYGTFPEYHTSLDDLRFVSPAGLQGAFAVLRDCLELIERNRVYRTTCIGEPQLSRRGLYPPLGSGRTGGWVRDLLNVLAYADGCRDLVDLSRLIELPPMDLYPVVDRLCQEGLLAEQSETSIEPWDGAE